ncbi:17135_t:CDS:1, partial [Funneliformis geosporum]
MDRPHNPNGVKEFFTTLQNLHLFDACTLKHSNDYVKYLIFMSSSSTYRLRLDFS